MKLPSPYQGREPNHTEGGKGYFYSETRPQEVIEWKPVDPNRPSRGIYPESVIKNIPINPEVIDLESGKSNSEYWQPEMVMNPEGCNHIFQIVDISKRELECQKCHFQTMFHVAINYFEESGDAYFILQGRQYPITN